MTKEKLEELLANHEKITVEYKESRTAIPANTYETVASFSNRYGGYIIFGADDNGNPVGINPKCISNMKKNFANQLNNSDKMSPTLYLSLEEFEIGGKKLMCCFVPCSSTVVKCNGRIFDRNEDGDFDITDSPIQVENLYARKIGAFNEHKIFPFVEDSDLKLELLPQVRQLIQNKNSEHEWLKMNDKDLLISAGLYEKDFVTGEKGYNLAAVMLFGKDATIRSCCPGYITDAIFRVENTERYDDRLRVQTNLIESYDLLMKFIQVHTSDKFFLIDNNNTSVRDIIAREVVTNILVHRDFSSAYPAKLTVEKDWLKTENWCRPRRHGNILQDEFSPYPKNPLIANFFTTMGRTESIGSGVKNLYQYTPLYSDGGKPVLFEDDVFKIEIPLTKEATENQKSETELNERESQIRDLISNNRKIRTEELADHFKVDRRTILRDISKMKAKIKISYDKKNGVWEL
ncbi:MAG: putative DNA binding domain-containing protein [Treponemataceae bacterium]|nr:putative DNA binding domain-containing protein [Treponemataceae bacterium]